MGYLASIDDDDLEILKKRQIANLLQDEAARTDSGDQQAEWKHQPALPDPCELDRQGA